jgi:hypothetical protein
VGLSVECGGKKRKEKEAMTKAVSRRDFLKFGGMGAVAAVGVASVIGMTPEQALAAEVEFVYTCPICGKHFSDYESLKEHFEKEHPNNAVPELAVLNINNTEYRVQIEPHWTLREALQYAVGLTGSAKEMCGRGACGERQAGKRAVRRQACGVHACISKGRPLCVITHQGVHGVGAFKRILCTARVITESRKRVKRRYRRVKGKALRACVAALIFNNRTELPARQSLAVRKRGIRHA